MWLVCYTSWEFFATTRNSYRKLFVTVTNDHQVERVPTSNRLVDAGLKMASIMSNFKYKKQNKKFTIYLNTGSDIKVFILLHIWYIRLHRYMVSNLQSSWLQGSVYAAKKKEKTLSSNGTKQQKELNMCLVRTMGSKVDKILINVLQMTYAHTYNPQGDQQGCIVWELLWQFLGWHQNF